MTDNLKDRLWANILVHEQNGNAGKRYVIVMRDALAHITDLEARLAAAEAENTRIKRQVETLKTGWGIADRDRIKAEAGEDALAEALAFYGDPSGWNQPPVKVLEGLFTTEYENQASKIRSDRGKVARAALAAYETRRKG